jgi:two-component system chemotaxis response regulator CheB
VDRGDIVFESLRAGAVDILSKPPIVADDAMLERHRKLIQRIKYAAGMYVDPVNRTVRYIYPGPHSEIAGSWNNDQITVICSSTGAVFEAVQHIAALPEDFFMPILMILDMDPKILPAFVDRFNETVALNVRESADGVVISSSTVYVGSTRQGFFIQRVGESFMLKTDPTTEYPIDSLLQSAALSFGVGALAVFHAGLDGDGLDGCRAIHNVGGVVIIQRRCEPWVPEVNRKVLEQGIYTGELMVGEFPWDPEHINLEIKTA